eukprot:scaffold20454_cov148-Skeletonema_marinoi.AAC.2
MHHFTFLTKRLHNDYPENAQFSDGPRHQLIVLLTPTQQKQKIILLPTNYVEANSRVLMCASSPKGGLGGGGKFQFSRENLPVWVNGQLAKNVRCEPPDDAHSRFHRRLPPRCFVALTLAAKIELTS